MKITKYFALSLILVGSAYAVTYTPEQTRKTIEMLNLLQLNANCAQASVTILASLNEVLTQQEKDAHRKQIKLYSEVVVQFHAFLEDIKNNNHKQLEKIKELIQA
jgi:hypothetical protein